MRDLIPSSTVLILVIGLMASIASAADTTSDLVGYWPLDGDATDESGNGNDGTLAGNPAWMAGRIGQAIELDGTDQHVDVPGFNLVTDTATFVAWINGWKMNEDQWTYTGIVFSRSANACGIGFGGNDSIHYTWNDYAENAWDWEGGPKIPRNEWAMVAAVIEPDKATAYVYTDVDGLQSAVNNIPHIEQTVDALKFGHDPNSAIRHFDGMIDEVRIYDRALSAEDLRELATGDGTAVAPAGRLATNWGAIKQ